MKIKNNYGFFMIIMIVMSFTGLSYAHWSDTIKIEGKAKMAHIKIQIISYKNLTSKYVEKYSTIDSELSEDGHLLTLYCTNLKPCWHVWLGLVTQNQGSLSANIKLPIYEFEGPDGFEDYFETKEFFYGPYPEETGFGSLEVWGGVKVSEDGPLTPDGEAIFITPNNEIIPFPTDPWEKTVIWIWIHVKATVPVNIQGIEGTLNIRIVDDLVL